MRTPEPGDALFCAFFCLKAFMKTVADLPALAPGEPLARAPVPDLDLNLDLDLDLNLADPALSTALEGHDRVPVPAVQPLQAPRAALHTAAVVEADEPDEWDKGVLKRLDPSRIRPMSMPNRDESAFESDAFESLRQSIVAAGGNAVAISVVQLKPATAEHDHELVAGARRLRACLQSRLPVLAIVRAARQVPAPQRMLEGIRENLERQNLSPFEWGRQLKHALDAGLFPSARALARAIGQHHSGVSEAINLASLPAEVIAAFASTAELQFRFEAPLWRALAKNPQAVRNAAVALQALPDRLPAKAVLARLVAAASAPLAAGSASGVGPSDTASKGVLYSGGQAVGRVQFDRRGHARITLGLPLTGPQQAALQKQVDVFVQRCTREAAGGGALGGAATPVGQTAAASEQAP